VIEDANLAAAQTALNDRARWIGETFPDRIDKAQQAALTMMRADLDALTAKVATLDARVLLLEKVKPPTK
jgi:hypothetical protein